MRQNQSSNSSSTPRATAQLHLDTEKKLLGYAMLAGATGVGVLAVVQPSNAEVVYTPAYKVIAPGTVFPLDLNHDGIVDFSIGIRTNPGGFRKTFSTRSSDGMLAYPAAKTNEIWGEQSASALPMGFSVGSNGKFTTDPFMGGASAIDQGPPRYEGQWAPPGGSEQNRYLGFKFVIDGQIHFGWARFNVQVRLPRQKGIKAVLTGYAYETEANKPIVTAGPSIASSHPATLGQLALGAAESAARHNPDAVVR